MAPQKKEPSAAALLDLPKVISGEWSRRRFARAHGVHGTTVGRWVEEYQAEEAALPDPGETFAAFENSAFEAMVRYQKEVLRLDSEVDEVTWVAKDGKPSLTIFMSDLHMGHVQSNHEQIRADCELIRNTPGVYVILGGDLIDNVNIMTAMRGSFHESISSVEMQKYFMDELIGYLGRDKVVAMILGNHDEWSLQSDGFNPIQWCADKHGIPYLGAFGFVNAHVGEQRYRLLCGHQFRMGSTINLTHSVKRFWEFHGDSDTDATFLGHRHEGASEQAPKQNKDRFFGQAGTYQVTSRYSARKGFGKASPKMPAVLLFPEEHHVVGVHDAFRDGKWMVTAARGATL